jgi:hypothetical protein
MLMGAPGTARPAIPWNERGGAYEAAMAGYSPPVQSGAAMVVRRVGLPVAELSGWPSSRAPASRATLAQVSLLTGRGLTSVHPQSAVSA